MLVTLNDSETPTLYDTEAKMVVGSRSVYGGHVLRLHIYDEQTNTATEKFVSHDKEEQDRIISQIRSRFGHVNHDNTWIKPVIKRQEFWDTSAEREMVLGDLQTYFGDSVTIRGTSKRYIYYISDGRLNTTPDAIGTMFGKPLVYKGLVMATIFDIDGLNPLSPGENIVHWLTGPMWRGFHDRFRQVPKDFPWPTGFVASYWCQREGYGSYRGGGIRIASMTQGQSVGRWANTSLRQFWDQRQGKDIFGNFGKTFKVSKAVKQNPSTGIFSYVLYAAGGNTPLGLIGLYCPKCTTILNAPYGACSKCMLSNSAYDLAKYTLCTKCGKAMSVICNCGKEACANTKIGCVCESPSFVKPKLSEHKTQYYALKSAIGASQKGGTVNVIEY